MANGLQLLLFIITLILASCVGKQEQEPLIYKKTEQATPSQNNVQQRPMPGHEEALEYCFEDEERIYKSYNNVINFVVVKNSDVDVKLTLRANIKLLFLSENLERAKVMVSIDSKSLDSKIPLRDKRILTYVLRPLVDKVYFYSDEFEFPDLSINDVKAPIEVQGDFSLGEYKLPLGFAVEIDKTDNGYSVKSSSSVSLDLEQLGIHNRVKQLEDISGADIEPEARFDFKVELKKACEQPV